MAVDNVTESSAVVNMIFPFIMVPFTEGAFGPEESAPLCGTYGEAGMPAPMMGAAANTKSQTSVSVRVGVG